MQDYLRDHFLLSEMVEDQRKIEITSGLVQGSILALDLWNAYDSLLSLDKPKESQ